MTERLTSVDRKALIVGDRADDLSPDEAAELRLLTRLLADPNVWAEPRPGLERQIVQAVVNAPPTARSWWRPRVLVTAAAATVAVLTAVASFVLASDGTSPAFTAELASTAVVPGAHASVEIAHTKGGFRITLDASGLQRQSDGSYYEAWLEDNEGTLVPIGTFSSSDEYVTLWSGVSPATFTTLTVTMEHADNVQASSGQVVLRGEVRPG